MERNGGVRPRRVSLAEVARRAGTSHSAASRTLNGRTGVRPDVRAAVLAAAKELGYVPNIAARNLVMQRTGLVALAFADAGVAVGTHFFSEVLGSIVAGLAHADYRTVLLLPDAQRYRSLDDVVQPNAFDAAIIVGHRTQDPLVKKFAGCDIPTVLLGRAIDGRGSYVDVDNVGAAVSVAHHLITAGSSWPALLATAPNTSWGQDRIAGFKSATGDARGAVQRAEVEVCDFSPRGGYAGVQRLLERSPDIDSILVSSETLLSGALAALLEAGRRIPEDLLLACFDDEPSQTFGMPPITAVRQPLDALGAELARYAIEAIADPTKRFAIQLPTELVVRASSRRAAEGTGTEG